MEPSRRHQARPYSRAAASHRSATRVVTSVLGRETLDLRVHETKWGSMYAVIRAYSGNADLADALAAREDDVRKLIGGIEGFKAYYLVRLAEGTSTISVFERQEGAEESSRVAAAWLAENLPD